MTKWCWRQIKQNKIQIDREKIRAYANVSMCDFSCLVFMTFKKIHIKPK